MSGARAPKILLDCSLRVEARRLVLRYQLLNQDARDFWVFDGVSADAVDGALDRSPDRIYADFFDGTLDLVKASPLDPPLECHIVWPRPDANWLPSGFLYTRKVRVRLPVKVRHPSRREAMERDPNTVAAVKPVIARRVRFVVGVAPVGPTEAWDWGTESPPTFIPVGANRDRSWGGPHHRFHETLLTHTFELDRDLPVLDYASVPPRQDR